MGTTPRLAFASLLVFGLAGCSSLKYSWDHYDGCHGAGGFVQMVDCGSADYRAYCASGNPCGPNRRAVVDYAESLKRSVSTGELTEAEAQRRWIDFRAKEKAR